MSKSKMIVRTTFIDRACHWTVVICFFLVALSGISFFFPTLQWLTETFGTPQMGRILHPFFGVLIFVALMFMFVRFVHHNIPDKQDIPAERYRGGAERQRTYKVARVGKYNAGQKMMFWTIMSMIFVLLVTGVIIWRPYFAAYFPIQVIRYSLLIHATSAIILIHAILIHMYMAFWVKGSIKGHDRRQGEPPLGEETSPALVSRCRTPGGDERESRRDEVSLHGANPLRRCRSGFPAVSSS